MKFKTVQSSLGLILFLGISFVPGIFGARFEPGSWYQALRKPALNPPSWVFGPVWTLLYALMGLCGWLLWRRRGEHRLTAPFILFAVQLLLNGLWSYLFFGLQRPGLALAEIVVLWAAVAATVVLFQRVSRPAGYLLYPYLLWVGFAVYLNGAIWRLNM